MMPTMFSSTTIPVLEQVINFAESRHNVLAGNIANIDTPGYRAADLSPVQFQKQLKEAIEVQRKQSSDPLPDDESIAPDAEPFGKLRETMHSLVYHDDSDVDIERQVAELTKNQMQHNLALSIMTKQFSLLQAAISERA